jgi:hypothetical protein
MTPGDVLMNAANARGGKLSPVDGTVGSLTAVVTAAIASGTMSIDALKKLIDDEAGKLQALIRQRAGLDKQIDAARTRLEAFQQSLALVTGRPTVAPHVTANGRIRQVIHDPDPWEDALAAMRRKGGSFTTDEIFDQAKSGGSDIDRVKARSRLAHLVDRKRLTRVEDGVFEFPRDA